MQTNLIRVPQSLRDCGCASSAVAVFSAAFWTAEIWVQNGADMYPTLGWRHDALRQRPEGPLQPAAHHLRAAAPRDRETCAVQLHWFWMVAGVAWQLRKICGTHQLHYNHADKWSKKKGVILFKKILYQKFSEPMAENVLDLILTNFPSFKLNALLRPGRLFQKLSSGLRFI